MLNFNICQTITAINPTNLQRAIAWNIPVGDIIHVPDKKL